MKEKILLKSALSIAILSVFNTASAENQTTEKEIRAIEKIQVTTQRRSESSQDVPVAISAFNGEMISKTGSDGVGDIIALVPGLTGSTPIGGTLNFWAIRGVASTDFTVGSEPSVGVYIDDAYIGRNVHALSSFFDINRVEVVKGPQGTLFGRNAAAGAISIITNKPELENSGSVGISFGNEGQIEYDFVGNWAVSENFALRGATHSTKLSGVIDDTAGGEGSYDKDAFRLTALWYVSDDVEATLAYNYATADTDVLNGTYNPFYQQFNDTPTADDGQEFPKTTGRTTADSEDVKNDGVNLRLTWYINNNITLTSITDYRSFEFNYVQDSDGSQADSTLGELFFLPPTSIKFFQPLVEQESKSQEFRLNGSTDNLDWFVGASYFKEDVGEIQEISLIDTTDSFAPIFGANGDVTDIANVVGKTESIGLYGDFNYAINDKLALTAGIRWSQDKKDWSSSGVNRTNSLGVIDTDFDFDGNANVLVGNETWSEVTTRFVIDYALSDDILLYTSFSEGYKGGGFNVPTLSTDASNDLILDAFGIPTGETLATAVPDADTFETVFFTGEAVSSFKPETSTSYELGIKGTYFEGILQLNAAAFLVEFEDLQVQNATTAGIITSNAAESETTGVEMDFIYMATDSLVLSGNYTYLDAKFKSGNFAGIDIAGNQLPFAPENAYSLSAAYDFDLRDGFMNFFTSYNWTDDYNNRADAPANLIQESYGLWNAKLSYQPASEAWSLSASVDNITDEGYTQFKQDIGIGGANFYRGLSRLWKISFNVYFE